MTAFSFCGISHQTGRVIGRAGGHRFGPGVVVFAGLHGNEPAGILALQRVFARLEPLSQEIHGHVTGLAGNLSALASGQRFLWHDLNRLWTREYARLARAGSFSGPDDRIELQQQRELLGIVDPLLASNDPLFFIDLHTTSAPSVPFVAINDQMANRRFALKFPVPTVLGIEEYLEGPLLSFLNDFGHVALAFEAGQHDAMSSVDAHESFVWMALVAAGVLKRSLVPDYAMHEARLAGFAGPVRGIFEVIHRHAITSGDGFSMRPGYVNFAPLTRNETLGSDCDGAVRSPATARIFMPLYQPSGEDGYFLVRPVPRWAMWLSAILRRLNFDGLLTWLPGVSRDPDSPHTLVVNKRVARLLARELFHLLGYRRKKETGEAMLFSRREIGPEPQK